MEIPTLFTGQKLIYLKSVDSTNRFALRLIENHPEQIPEGTIVTADYQTSGKGQFHRKWISQPGQNLTFSLIIKPAFLFPENMFYLNKCVSISLIETLDGYLPKKTLIKWPNDIYVNNKKICGILIENKIKGNKMEFAVLGIGLNVNQTEFPEDLKATSLQLETGNYVDKKQVFKTFCSIFEKNYLKLKSNLQSFDSAYLNKLNQLNEWQWFKTRHMKTRLLVKGIDANGRLITEDKNGIVQHWLSGELEWINE